MKKILVPTDFSECANAAEKYALFLAKKLEAEVHYLHVIHTPVDWSKLTKEQERLFPDVMHQIGTAKESLKARIKEAEAIGIVASKMLVFNNANDKIHKIADEEGIDLVVMGSHGQYGIKDQILGTNTYSMLRRSDIPVIIIKKDIDNPKLETMVFATNFKEVTGWSFSHLERLAEALGVRLQILYVNTPNPFMETNDILDLGKSFLYKHSNYNYDVNIIDAYTVERGIVQFLKKGDYDGVAIITEGRSDLAQYFSPSVTENLISETPLPVLSLRITR